MTDTIVTAPADLTVRSVAPFAETLAAAIAAGDPVAIDLAPVEHPDLSLLQLVEAARREAEARGTPFALAAPATGAIAAALDRAGFPPGFAPADHQFWYQGEPAR